MSDDLSIWLLDDAPDARERRDAWLRSVSPERAEPLVRWEAFENALERRVSRALPHRELPVLLALAEAGRGDALDTAERALLAALPAGLQGVRGNVTAIDPVIGSISADIDAFDEAWEEHVEAHRTGSRPTVADPLRPAAPRLPIRRAPARFAVRWLTAAVVVLFAVTVTLLARRDTASNLLVAGDTVRVETLADGSVVRLHPGSVLHVNAQTPRSVRLEGRAFFDVRHEPSRFVVETAQAVVSVLGTAFAVTAGQDETEIILVSGRVAAASVDRPGDLVVLQPGDRTTVALGGRPRFPDPVDVERTLEWTGLLIFRATPMSRVAQRLRSVYGDGLDIDPALASEQVTGMFTPEQSLGEVAAVLAEALGARLEPDGAGGLRLRL